MRRRRGEEEEWEENEKNLCGFYIIKYIFFMK